MSKSNSRSGNVAARPGVIGRTRRFTRAVASLGFALAAATAVILFATRPGTSPDEATALVAAPAAETSAQPAAAPKTAPVQPPTATAAVARAPEGLVATPPIVWPADARGPIERAVRRLIEQGPEATPPAPLSRRAAILRGRGALGAQDAGDPLLVDLVFWRTLHGDGDVDWSAYADFAERRPDWPLSRAAQLRIERSAPEGLDRRKAAAFFEKREPVGLRGARFQAEAMIAAGERDAGEAALKRAFVEKLGTRFEERAALDAHTQLLSPLADRRLEAMALRGEFAPARRMAELLPEDDIHRRAVKVAEGLWRGLRGATRSYRSADAEVQAASYVRRALARRQMRAKRPREAEATIRAADVAGAVGDPAAWAALRMRLARAAWRDGRSADAQVLSAAHGLSRGIDFAELAWFAGWLALEELGDREAALAHFNELYEGVGTPISRARAAYWSARASGSDEERELWLERAAAHPQTFYGQLAAEVLDREVSLFEPPAPDAAVIDAMAETPLAQAAATLHAAGLRRDSRRFFAALARQDATAQHLAIVARVARRYGDAWAEIAVGKVGERRGQPIWSALYPAPRRPAFDKLKNPPETLLAIARQESRFDPGARSSAGALGLLQLLPTTARAVAKDAGLPYERDRLTSDPLYNVRLGDRYFDQLLRWRNSHLLAVASYNAGGGNVNKWIGRFGDPSTADIDPVAWIERIPFAETRSYAHRVLEARQVYKLRVAGGVGRITLSEDLGAGDGARHDFARYDAALAAAAEKRAERLAAQRATDTDGE